MRTVLLAAGIAALATGPVSAAESDGVTPQELFNVLQAAGVEPAMEEDAEKEMPVIGGTMVAAGRGLSFYVAMHSCSGAGPHCKAMQFYSTFTVPNAMTPEMLAKVNAFNSQRIGGRAFAVEGTLALDFLVIADGPDPASYVDRRLNDFNDIVIAFVEQFGS